MKRVKLLKYGKQYSHPRHYQLNINDLDTELFEILEQNKPININAEDINYQKKKK